MGKRELKKQQKYFDFLAAAARLFAEKGVDETTMQEIAANVATGTKTLNRYFPSKNSIIMAILKEDDRISIKRAEIQARSTFDNPVDLICCVYEKYVDYANIINNLAVWQEYESVRIKAYNKSKPDIGSIDLRKDIVELTKDILRKLINKHLLKEGISPEKLTSIIHAILLLNYHKTLRGNFISEAEALASLRAEVSFFLEPYLVSPMKND
ncbi:TetR/AcrR family transcriptional regulator [Brucella intermedia]|uniref:TetR/AcrR family transcriptional regulator n=1 Tax=Brucella intermedia TaxID=94625 RepID=UPI00235ECCA8|nr:TetR/AcrR family transcriptional regulator [Brucella intermedia]